MTTVRGARTFCLPGRVALHSLRPQRPRRWTCLRSASTHIESLILDSIKATGPISFATYTQLCLAHPTHGYYMHPAHSVFGTRGDFVTSPEISQVFGEMVAVWLVSKWVAADKPSMIRLVELGPGRGTLMDDILRVVFKFVPKNVHIPIHLIETSRPMRATQKTTLTANPYHSRCEIQWHDSLRDVPRDSSVYTMLIAHEFFDALPVHILRKMDGGWHEVMIDAQRPDSTLDQISLDNNTVCSPPVINFDTPRVGRPTLRRVLTPTPTASSLLLGLSSPRFSALAQRTTMEVSPTSFRIARQVGELLSSKSQVPPNEDGVEKGDGCRSLGGCGLIIDYGANHVFEDSFRAFKNHKQQDVFHRPGECDLTSNVDFAYLKEAMKDLVITHGPLSQRLFLTRMGLSIRVEALARAADSNDARDRIKSSAERLVDQKGMGEQYRVLGISTEDGDQDVWPFFGDDG